MLKNTLAFLVLLGCLSACKQEISPGASEQPITRALHYLWGQQGPDGGWHSETHGILRGGESYTAFILSHLLAVPDSIYPKQTEKIDKALEFLRARINEEGYLGLADPDIVDYPNYATAHALRCFLLKGTPTDKDIIRKMTQYLVSQQFDEDRGIATDHPAYGAWGFGEQHIPAGQTMHVDLSHTRRILESLRMAGLDDETLFEKSHQFLAGVQKWEQGDFDGGFFASTITTGTNKGGQEGSSYKSYATATCDGLLGLLASGYPRYSQPVVAALDWLYTHAQLEYPEGIPLDDPGQWHRIMFYYHLSVRAEAFAATGAEGDWQNTIQQILSREQKEDGSFLNPMGGPNKEDDPLLATTLAVIAMHHCLK